MTTPADDIKQLHDKAVRMYKTSDQQKHSDIIKLQMDTLDALTRLCDKFKAFL